MKYWITVLFFSPPHHHHLGVGSHGYSSQSDVGSGFHSGHFVHMRGLPFRATEGDIAKVRKRYSDDLS